MNSDAIPPRLVGFIGGGHCWLRRMGVIIDGRGFRGASVFIRCAIRRILNATSWAWAARLVLTDTDTSLQIPLIP